MRSPYPPNATRFFARVIAGVLECPRCGLVMPFSSQPGRNRGTKAWNRRTSQLDCWQCGLKIVIGLIAWPVQVGGSGRTLPTDQAPNERQLAQLRAMQDGKGAGWWMPDDQPIKARRAYHSNITAACLCGEYSDGTPKYPPHPNCPLHGDAVPASEEWAARNQPRADTEEEEPEG